MTKTLALWGLLLVYALPLMGAEFDLAPYWDDE